MKQKPKSQMTLIEWLDRFPPRYCRLVARTGTSNGQLRPLTPEEFAAKSGLTVRMVHILSPRTTWKGVDVDIVERFRAAAGITFATESAQAKYLRRSVRESARPVRHVHKLRRKDKMNIIGRA